MLISTNGVERKDLLHKDDRIRKNSLSPTTTLITDSGNNLSMKLMRHSIFIKCQNTSSQNTNY